MDQFGKWVEPSGDKPAGYFVYKRSHSPYERWMEEQGIPILRGIGVRDTRDVTLGTWRRRDARGAFLYLDGLEGTKGMYVLEVPSAGATEPEKHIYDEFFLVIEGRGTTEVWRGDENSNKQVFEWQPGTLFMIPINASYRLVNATSSPALLLAANNAPGVFNTFQSHRFIFENDWDFRERYEMTDDFFKINTELEMEPVRGRAAIRSNVFPDIVNAELPLDNQRAPGYRRIQPTFSGFIQDASTGGFIAEYPSGRYSKAHYHSSGAVLVCLRGKGITYNWPVDFGPRPWQGGHGDQVRVLEYVPGGLVAAAPGGGMWFHQHFGIGKEPLRVINYWGGPHARWGIAEEKDEDVKAGNLFGIHEGGRTILYHEEDPFIRTEYRRRLAEEGVQFAMPESAFDPPLAAAPS
ncbi:MAG: cupin domain-containing protein [Chloroflexi bacterium]|nr:cupin domain-containing protein [Chloroflexota bacterium]